MAEIRCPRCAWQYTPGMQWMCAPDGCGAYFDTFQTHGKCPQCNAKFSVTWCPACHKPSPHSRWYADSPGETGGDSGSLL